MPILTWLSTHYKPIIVVFLAVLIILNVGVLVRSEMQSRWDPIEDYMTQEVLAGHETITLADGTTRILPTIHFNPAQDPELRVKVHAVKCVDSVEPISVEGRSGYEIIYPSEITIVGTTTVSTRSGCVDKTFENLIPYVIVNQIAGTPPGPVIMRLYGVETPVAADGSMGKPKRWQTEDFAIVH